MGPSDGQSAATFQSGLRVFACSLRGTMYGVWNSRCMQKDLRGQGVECGSTSQHVQDYVLGQHVRRGWHI